MIARATDSTLVAVPVEPCFLIEARGVDDERIAFPFPNRIPHVCGGNIGRVRASIHKDLPDRVIIFVKDNYFLGSLHKLKRKWLQVDSWRAGRQARSEYWIVGHFKGIAAGAVRRLGSLVLLLSPRSHVRAFRRVGAVEEPALRGPDENALGEGDVVTVEPGLYLMGLGGVRIEDTGMVTRDGFKNFTTLTRSLDPRDYL